MSLDAFSLAGSVFLLSFWMAGGLCRGSSRLLDHPNERSLHTEPTPRTGGLAIFAALTVGIGLLWVLQRYGAFSLGEWREEEMKAIGWIAAMTVLTGVVSFWDDRAGLPPGIRFGIHAAAAAGAVLGGGLTVRTVVLPVLGPASLGWAAVPLTMLLLVWGANLYNFMDGMDGFASGMTVIGCGFMSALASMAGHNGLGVVFFLIGGAAGGFLSYNMPPARIFMGDVGSIPLGFLIGSLSLMGVKEGDFDLWTAGLIFSPFIVDATVTLVRRMLRGEKFWQAHREHYYQRLVLIGWGHRRTVLAEYGLMLACGISALLVVHVDDDARFFVLSAWTLIYCTLAFGVRMIERNRTRSVQRTTHA